MTLTENSKILAIFAHPDDEVLWGWPLMQQGWVDQLFICSNDVTHGKEERRTVNRKIALEQACRAFNIPVVCEDEACNFSKFRPDYNKWRIRGMAFWKDWDYIFTHNPHGEYGHIDHRFVFSVLRDTGRPLVYTDMYRDSIKPKRKYKQDERGYYKYFWGTIEQDRSWFDIGEAIYRHHGAWTWQKSDESWRVNECGVYIYGE